MARTTADAVKALMLPGKDYDTDAAPSLTPFIDTATALVDRVNACAADKDITLSATELELIERWLAAHLYVMSDQQYASKNTDGASASFRAAGGLNLDGSTYGQTAKLVDYSGCLASLSTRSRARLLWGGLPPSEQTDYTDRD